MEQPRVGFAFCGSFCTLARAVAALRECAARGWDLYPILSAAAASTDTRFGKSHEWLAQIEGICGRKAVTTVAEAEPFGPKKLLDALVVCPCTGNTLAKLAHGVADGPVTMSAKSHLRNGRPLILAPSTNDGLAAAAPNIGLLLERKNVYFVPFGQDDWVGKPTSLVADIAKTAEAVEWALQGKQIQPVLIRG